MPKLADTSIYTYKAGGPNGSGADYQIRLSNRYNDTVATILGLTKTASDSATGEKVTTNEAVRKGQLVKLRINFRQTSGHKRGSANILCGTGHVETAIASLVGKKWGTEYEIVSVGGVPKVKYR